MCASWGSGLGWLTPALSTCLGDIRSLLSLLGGLVVGVGEDTNDVAVAWEYVYCFSCGMCLQWLLYAF